MPAEYKALTNRPVYLGQGGLPRANPYFGSAAEDMIRHEPCCCGSAPGPSVPVHWYDAGLGWVTKYFTDVVSFDRRAGLAGRYRCQVPMSRDGRELCQFEIQDEPGCCACSGAPWWCASGTAPMQMLQHIVEHRIADSAIAPRRRAWSSGLFDLSGCAEVCCCSPCNGARQMMALSGWEDTFDWGWCMFFAFLGVRLQKVGDYVIPYYIPPHVYVALMTRPLLVRLNSIDEGCCTTFLTVFCCAPCSVAQTNRELAFSGVWPGGSCGGVRPVNYNQLSVGSAVTLKDMI